MADIPDAENPFTPIGRHLKTMRDAMDAADMHMNNIQRKLDEENKKKKPASPEEKSPAVRDLGL